MNQYDFDTYLQKEKGTWKEEAGIILHLSLPAILAQLTSIAMQYIDAGMVGSLGAKATAAIGLVLSSTWLVGEICIGLSSGFSVQVAQLTGARQEAEARDVFRQSLTVLLFIGLGIAFLGTSISRVLPVWLGGSPEILSDAGTYFFIYSCSIPFSMMRYLSAGMMQCSGDMKTPGILSGLLCLLDVIFNMFFIFP